MEISTNNNYVTYHLHSDYSLLDSCTDYKDYIDKAVKLGQKAICFTEHGKQLGWVAKKMYCDEKNIKYLHGVECYLTESLSEKKRDNFHTILIAKNQEGFKELDELISKSTDTEHFYYVNRISFDEFFNVSDNIIKISACLASPLNQLPISHEKYEQLVRHYDYLEIQPHNHIDQKNFNIHLAALSKQYNKPLIAGTDTHSLNRYKAECRSILLKAKHKSYGDEDSFDLTYKSYEELVKAFKDQNALPQDVFLEAINNTNIMADSVEEFKLDTTLKYPILYGTRERDKQVFQETIKTKFKEKIEQGIIPKNQIENFKKAIEEESRVFSKIEMDGFMLSMSELISWCKNNDIPVGIARGSVSGSRIAYVTDITDLNPETWHTIFSRFCNEDRKEVGDIDVDIIDTDRPKIFEYIINRFGVNKTSRVPSYGTLASKSVIDEIGRALDIIWKEKHTETSPYSLENIKKIKSAFDKDEERTRAKYPDIFYYFDGLSGIKVSQSVHPAGMVISPIDLPSEYGVFQKDDMNCIMIDMDEIHEIGLVKYDFLILKNIKILNDICKMTNIPYPKSHEINWNDENVWNDMVKNPVGIFQMEGDFAHSLLRQFQPKSIFDMSLVTACIRPSGASYRNDLMKKIPNKNPSEIIDNLLSDNLGYLVYQEDVIKFLQEICGLSGSDADNIRRAIGRKDEERLRKALPQILEGYCRKSDKPRNIAEEEAKQFIKIIEDASSYMFGYNHSIAYCMIGYLCAYFRYYYPYEFVTSYLNNAANEEDITNGTELANEYHITITPPKYGISKDKYVYDKEHKIIAKGISSVKYLNADVPLQLYELSKNNYEYFSDLLFDISNKTSINSKQLNNLLIIDYFSMFGNIPTLMRIISLFDFFKKGKAKTISKQKIENEWLKNIISEYSTDINAKGVKLKSYTVLDYNKLIHRCEDYIKSLNIPDISLKAKMCNQLELLGYIDLTTNKEEDRRKLIITDVIPLKNKSTGTPWGYAVFVRSIGSGKSSRLTVKADLFNDNPLEKMDIIYARCLDKNKSGYWYLLDYEKNLE